MPEKKLRDGEGRLFCPPQSGFQLKEVFSSALTASCNIKPQKPVLLHQKMIYSLKLMIWNNRLVLVKINYYYLEKWLEKVSFSFSGSQMTILKYNCSRRKLHLDCSLGTCTVLSFN